MNELLLKANRWFSELSIKTQLQQNCVKVSVSDMLALSDSNSDKEHAIREFMSELSSALETKRFIWSYIENDWAHLETL